MWKRTSTVGGEECDLYLEFSVVSNMWAYVAISQSHTILTTSSQAEILCPQRIRT
jgi:hypothetical protein